MKKKNILIKKSTDIVDMFMIYDLKLIFYYFHIKNI
jgi:hypothetical protein